MGLIGNRFAQPGHQSLSLIVERLEHLLDAIRLALSLLRCQRCRGRVDNDWITVVFVADVIDNEVLVVGDALAEQVTISGAFAGVHEFRTWGGDARNVVEEGLTEHHVGQGAGVDVAPDVALHEHLSLVDEKDVDGDLDGGRWCCLHGSVVAVLEGFGRHVAPARALADQVLR